MRKKSIILHTAIIVILLLMSVAALSAADVYREFNKINISVSSEGYIKWVEFNASTRALRDAADYDIKTYGTSEHVTMPEIIAYLCIKNGNNFSKYSSKSLKALTDRLEAGEKMPDITSGMKLYGYYLEAMEAVIGGFVGKFYDSDGNEKYGLCVFSPIAEGYYYNHYDDFGASRSFGFRREHLGHDLMGSIGTPIIAVESGYVEALGWNPYGGWRIGIRSFDSKRYYYYAHLRKNHPYNDMYEGKLVNAGEVIGYLGMTGYSTKENTNNIDTPHLHYGLQLIFDKSQKDGNNQIWVDMYALTDFLRQQKAKVTKSASGNEYISKNYITISESPD